MDKKAVTELLRGTPSILVRDVAETEGWEEFTGVARTLMCLPLKRDSEIVITSYSIHYTKLYEGAWRIGWGSRLRRIASGVRCVGSRSICAS